MRLTGELAALVPEALESEDYLLLAGVVALPWAFGGVEVWAYRTASLLIAAAAAVSVVKHGRAGLGLDRSARWLLPALLLGMWAAVQIVPAPPAMVRVVSPEADAVYRATFPGYAATEPDDTVAAIRQRALEATPEFDGIPLPHRERPLVFAAAAEGRWQGWRTISLLPSAGVDRLLWYASLLLAFLVVRRRCAIPQVSRLYRGALFGLFLALSVFGLIYAATSNNKLYWVRETLELARPFGPYVNPTNFAGVMEMAVPWLAGYLLLNVRVSRGQPLAALRSPMVVAATLLCIAAGLATAAKSSAILIGASLFVLLLVSARGIKQRLVVLVGTSALVAAAVPLLGRTLLGERFRQFVDMTGGQVGEVGRMAGWRSAVEMARDFLVTGTGFGAFRDVFPRYMPPGESARWVQLHNDYYELLIEGGIIAVVLLVWLAVGFWLRALRREAVVTERRLNPEAIGLLLGLLALMIHAGFDFNHQIPANALLFVTLAAMAVVRGEDLCDPGSGRGLRAAGPLRVAVALVLIGLFGARAAVGLWSGPAYAKGRHLAARADYTAAISHLERGTVGPYRSAMYWLRGQTRVGLWQDGLARDEDPQSLVHHLEQAHREYTRAISMSPASGWYWLALGELYHAIEQYERYRNGIGLDLLGQDPWHWVGDPGRVAIGMTRVALEYEPNVYTFHDQLAIVLWGYRLREASLEAVRQSARVQPVYRFHVYRNMVPEPPEVLDAFRVASREALGQTPFLRETLHRLALGRLEYRSGNLEQAEQDLRAALEAPGELLNRAEAHYYLGMTLAGRGRSEEALESLALAEAHPNFQAASVVAQARLAEQEGNLVETLRLLRRARRIDPRNMAWVFEFARVAEAAEEWKKVEEALRWGATLDPGDPRPWRRLVQFYRRTGRRIEARQALEELARIEGETEAVIQLRRQLEIDDL
jgi:tetratricopeptide (TPR) repeat protein